MVPLVDSRKQGTDGRMIGVGSGYSQGKHQVVQHQRLDLGTGGRWHPANSCLWDCGREREQAPFSDSQGVTSSPFPRGNEVRYPFRLLTGALLSYPSLAVHIDTQAFRGSDQGNRLAGNSLVRS